MGAAERIVSDSPTYFGRRSEPVVYAPASHPEATHVVRLKVEGHVQRIGYDTEDECRELDDARDHRDDERELFKLASLLTAKNDELERAAALSTVRLTGRESI